MCVVCAFACACVCTVRCSRRVAHGALLTVLCSVCVAHGALLTVRHSSWCVAHGALLTVLHSRCVAHSASLTVRGPSVRCSRCVVCRGHRDLRLRTHSAVSACVCCERREFELSHTHHTVARGGSRRSQRAAGRASAARWLRRQRGYTRPRPRRTWRSCSTASTCMLSTTPGQKPLHALHVAPCATKASARARAATSTLTRRPRERMSHARGGTSARRPRAQPACRTAAPSSGSAATASTAGAGGKASGRATESFWTSDGRKSERHQV